MRVPDASPMTPLEALRQAAIERPDDESVHLVYADALLEAGDPLGELIVAQCRDPHRIPNEEEFARAAGPLYRAGAAFGVRRGILRTILLKRVTPTQLRRLVGKPAWEPVFAIEFGRGRCARAWPTQPLVDLVTHPVCRRLSELYFLHLEGLVRLLPIDRRFELVHVDVNDETQYPELAETSVQLKIRELVIDCAWPTDRPLHWLLGPGSRVLEAAESLALSSHGFDVVELIPNAPPSLVRLSSEKVIATRSATGWDLVLVPHEVGATAVWLPSAEAVVDVVDGVVRWLGDCVSSVTVRGANLGVAAASGLRSLDVPVDIRWEGPPVDAMYEHAF